MTDVKFSDFSASDLVAVYINLRQQKKDLAEAMKVKAEPIDRTMRGIEAECLRRMQAEGTDAVKTPEGTVYQLRRTSLSVRDRTAFFEWLKDTGDWDMADLRASKCAIQSRVDEGGELPPGLNMSSMMTVGFRAR